MSWGLQWLGLEPGADEREIKRAYAQLLRTTRPDEDPEGFQRLHAAYRDALAAVEHESDSSAPVRSMQTPQDGTAIEPLDIATVAQRIVEQAAALGARELDAWLQALPELWSLDDKPRIGIAVFSTIEMCELRLTPSVFDCLSLCFGWDDLNSPLWQEDVERVRRRCEQGWLLSSDGEQALARRYIAQTNGMLMPEGSVLRSMRRPRPRWRNRLTALIPGRAAEAVGLLSALEYWYTRQTPPGLDPGQVAFWARFGTHPRLHTLYGGARICLAGLVLGLICTWGVVSSWPLPPSEGGWFSGPQKAVVIILGATLFGPLVWAAGVSWRALVHWQLAWQPSSPMPRLLWKLVVPLLVLVSIAVLWLGLRWTDGMPWGALSVTWLISALTLHLAWARRMQRQETPSQGNPGDALSLLGATVLLVPAWGAALLCWWMDLRDDRT